MDHPVVRWLFAIVLLLGALAVARSHLRYSISFVRKSGAPSIAKPIARIIWQFTKAVIRHSFLGRRRRIRRVPPSGFFGPRR